MLVLFLLGGPSHSIPGLVFFSFLLPDLILSLYWALDSPILTTLLITPYSLLS